MKTAIIYARKSSESEGQQTLSIESQIAELTALAEREGLTISSIFQESCSAGKPNRPAFEKMLSDMKRRPGVTILCWQLDRLARNLQDAATLTQMLQDGIIREIRTPRATYGSSSMDLFITGLDFLIAKKYVDDLSENVKRGLREKVRLGFRPGKVPLGYKTSGPYQKGLREIVPDPRTFDQVRKLWDRILRSPASLSILHKHAKHLGLTLCYSSLCDLFSNPFYYGHFKWNGELFEGKHEPMVTYQEFSQVQEYIHRKTRRQRSRHQFTFTRLLTCGECGSAATAELKSKYIKSIKSKRTYIYYHCTRSKDRQCTQRSITESEIINQITAHLLSIAIPVHEAARQMDTLQNRLLEQELNSRPRIATLQSELREVDHQISSLLALHVSPANADRSLITDDEFKREKNKLLIKRQELLESIAGHERSFKKVQKRVGRFINLAVSGRRQFETGTQAQRREILKSLESNCKLSDRTLVFTKPISGNHARFPVAVGKPECVRTD